jgi:hypothetical protein
MLLRLMLLVFGLAGGMLHAQPSGDPTAAFAAGSDAFAAGDYRAAVQWFEQARDGGLAGPAVHYNLGVAQYRVGDYAAAEATFRLIGERFPAMRSLAEYNLGLALWRQGRTEAAIAMFRRAALGDDRAVVSLATAMLTRLGTAAPPPPRRTIWLSLFDVRVGHDDNVVLVDESILPPGQEKESAFAELIAYTSAAASAESGPRFDASAYMVRYPDADRYDQGALRLGGAWRWSFSDWRLDLGPHYNWNTLGGDRFEQRIGASIDLRRALGARSALTLRLLIAEVDELDRQFSFIAGRREQLRVGLDQRTDAGRLQLGWEYERNDRDDPGVSPDRMRLLARYRHRIGPNWTADLGGAWRASRYRDLPETREEDLLELAVGGIRALPRGWQLAAEYRWADNDANVDVYSYRRNRFQLGISRVF